MTIPLPNFAPPKHWPSQFYLATTTTSTTHAIHKSAVCRALHKCSGYRQGSLRLVVFPNAHAQAPAYIVNSAPSESLTCEQARTTSRGRCPIPRQTYSQHVCPIARCPRRACKPAARPPVPGQRAANKCGAALERAMGRYTARGAPHGPVGADRAGRVYFGE
jgi:hypothetical protein